MATGLVDSWTNVDKFGAVYPFPGSETLMVLLALVVWLGWHIWQIKEENAEFKADVEKIKGRGGVGKVLDEELQREIQD